VSVFLAIVLMVAAAAALTSVVVAVVVRRRIEVDRAERQLLAARQPRTSTTYAYDESGALISAKTGPARSLGDQLPT
jgi:YD repeat-containing protein